MTLKIAYISDLHLDFWVPFHKSQLKWKSRTQEFVLKLIEEDTSAREVICLGGDFSHFNRQTLWILEVFSAHYEQVFCVVGNHDYYLVSNNQETRYKKRSANRISELYELYPSVSENIHFFQKDEVMEFKGIRFGGNTMWYPLEKPEHQFFFQDVSNDSKLIKGLNMENENKKSLNVYRSVMEQGVDVFLTHVPIIPIKSHERYASFACYYTPVNQLPKYIVQGHSHENAIYTKAGSLIYMNCAGYPEENTARKPKIESFEID